jgi:uncharacterized protein (DUF952 family)
MTQQQQPQYVYKLLTTEQWNEMQEERVFKGSPVDLKDGYIHLSSKETVVKTAEISFLAFPYCLWVRIGVGKEEEGIEERRGRGRENLRGVFFLT